MQYAAREAEKRMRLEQQEQRRHAASQPQQLNSSGVRPAHSYASEPGQTIVESLDGAVASKRQDQENEIEGSDDDLAAVAKQGPEHQVRHDAVRVKRRRKRPLIHKQGQRKYSAVRQRRRKPKVSYNSGFAAAKPGKVWPGDRPRRR